MVVRTCGHQVRIQSGRGLKCACDCVLLAIQAVGNTADDERSDSLAAARYGGIPAAPCSCYRGMVRRVSEANNSARKQACDVAEEASM